MIDLTVALNESANSLVSGLPAGAVVDLTLREFPRIQNSKLPHQGLPSLLDTWESTGDSMLALHTCANPATLFAAFDRYANSGRQELLRVILTNPATPRTPQVIDETARQAADPRCLDGLQHMLIQQYVSARRGEFDRVTHEDLAAAATSGEASVMLKFIESLGVSLSRHWTTSGVSRFPDDNLFAEPVAERINDGVIIALTNLNKLITGRDPDGTIRLRPSRAEAVSHRMARLLQRHPTGLSNRQTAALRRAITGLHEKPYGSGHFICTLGLHALNHQDVADMKWLGPVTLRDRFSAADANWARTWVADGLHEVLDLHPHPVVLREVGRVAYQRFGEDPAAWSVFLDLLREGWKGSFQNLLNTVESTT